MIIIIIMIIIVKSVQIDELYNKIVRYSCIQSLYNVMFIPQCYLQKKLPGLPMLGKRIHNPHFQYVY